MAMWKRSISRSHKSTCWRLDEIERKREAYLSEKPDPSDPQAIELTNRLLATAGVEIHGAYLPQLRDVYCPVEASVEYPDSFDALHNIRHMNITKWIVDPKEDSLEKLINVYDVLADEDCNIALVFNRTSSTTNVYLAVVDTNNTDAVKGNFPGSEISDPQRGSIPCLQERHPFSVAAVSNVPTEKNDRFMTQTIEKVLDGIVPRNRSEDYTHSAARHSHP